MYITAPANEGIRSSAAERAKERLQNTAPVPGINPLEQEGENLNELLEEETGE
jgi:hypothetical protein